MKTIAHCRIALSITILLLTTLLCAVGLTTPPLQAATHTSAAWDTPHPDTFQGGNQSNHHDSQLAESAENSTTPAPPNHQADPRTYPNHSTGSDQNIGGIDWQVIGVSRYEN